MPWMYENGRAPPNVGARLRERDEAGSDRASDANKCRSGAFAPAGTNLFTTQL